MTAEHAQNTAGVFPGHADSNGVANLAKWEQWLGHKVPYIQLNVVGETWSQFTGTTWGNYERTTPPPNWSTRQDVVICTTFGINAGPGGQAANVIRPQLQGIANGQHDTEFTRAANRLINAGHENAIIRLGHEQDITWYPWSALGGNHDVYIAAYRHVHGVLKGLTGNKFRFAYEGNGGPWNRNATYGGQTKTLAEWCYPGDQYVDIVAFNCYDRADWSVVKGLVTWAQNYAVQKNKPFALSEWGLHPDRGDNPTFIQNMHDWLATLPATGAGRLLYHGYHQANPLHHLDKYPNAKARYLNLFGGANTTTPPPIIEPPTPPAEVGELEARVTTLENSIDDIYARLSGAGDALTG